MDNGEIAHVAAVSVTYNNGPDNLIYLCPNHHTEYDYGYKPSRNLTPEVVHAAKVLKRDSRRRRMRFEANAVRSLVGLVKFLREVQTRIKKGGDPELIDTYLTESRNLLASIPDLVSAAEEAAKADQDVSEAAKAVTAKAPTLVKLTLGAPTLNSASIEAMTSQVLGAADDIFGDLDEVDCPHCGGRGTTGLVQDVCGYCKGDCVVTHEEHNAYDRSQMDEVACPHCDGRGTTGLSFDLCAYCKGSCVVSQEEHDAYDRSQIDEVDCPHCDGRGTTGLNQKVCAICKGSQVVTRVLAAAYRTKYGDRR